MSNIPPVAVRMAGDIYLCDARIDASLVVIVCFDAGAPTKGIRLWERGIMA